MPGKAQKSARLRESSGTPVYAIPQRYEPTQVWAALNERQQQDRPSSATPRNPGRYHDGHRHRPGGTGLQGGSRIPNHQCSTAARAFKKERACFEFSRRHRRSGVIGSLTRAEVVSNDPQSQVYPYREHPVYLLWDSETAHLQAILIGEITDKRVGFSSIMALRTAATSGVGFRHLARKNARTAGVYGAGGQALHKILDSRTSAGSRPTKCSAATPTIAKSSASGCPI